MRPALLALAFALAASFGFHPFGSATAASPGESPRREMAVTFDDLPGVVGPGEGTPELRSLTKKLLSAIAAARVPAIGFVNEGKLGPPDSPDPERVALLDAWVAAGRGAPSAG